MSVSSYLFIYFSRRASLITHGHMHAAATAAAAVPIPNAPLSLPELVGPEGEGGEDTSSKDIFDSKEILEEGYGYQPSPLTPRSGRGEGQWSATRSGSALKDRPLSKGGSNGVGREGRKDREISDNLSAYFTVDGDPLRSVNDDLSFDTKSNLSFESKSNNSESTSTRSINSTNEGFMVDMSSTQKSYDDKVLALSLSDIE